MSRQKEHFTCVSSGMGKVQVPGFIVKVDSPVSVAVRRPRA
ncbi:hypothetical protein ACLEQD_26870 [Corallococcus sp. 4LFB]